MATETTANDFPQQDFTVFCGDCKYRWLVAVIPMELGRFCEKLDAAVKGRCPKCDSRSVKCGTPSE